MPMKMRSWLFLLTGFGALLLLIGLPAVALHNRMERVRASVQALQQAGEQSTGALEGLRSETYVFAILLRDYLLERSPDAATQQRRTLLELRGSIRDRLRALEGQGQLKDRHEIQRLRTAIEDYWRAAEPVFKWTPAQKTAEGPGFLRRHVAPQRRDVLELTSEIENLARSQSRASQQEILRTQEDLQGFLRRFAALALILGAVVAAVSVARTRWLEATTARHLRQIEHDAEDLRRLSLKLAKTQEDERKSLSRELHDQVGQMLTALRIELGNIEEFRHDSDGGFARHMTDARKLAEDTLRTVRDISKGLRPSVLDELGLGPALSWQAREFTRRCGVPVEVQVSGRLDGLTESKRTCVFRVVQEALTNCARHAQASHIRITLEGSERAIGVTVEDDGVGFDVQASRSRGLGLLGVEERVKEPGGRIEISSQPSKGALLHCDLPVSVEACLSAT